MEDIKKKRSLRLPARASIWYVGSGVAVKLVGLICTPLFTRLLSEGDFGAYSYYMSLLASATSLSATLFSPAIIYKGLAKFEDEGDAYFRNLLSWKMTVIAVICTLLFAFNGFFAIERGLVVFLLLQLLCDAVTSLYEVRARYYYSYRTVVFINLAKAIFVPALSLFLILRFELGYVARIISLFAVSLFPSLYILTKNVARGSPFDKNGTKFIIKQSLPLLPLAISSASNSTADRIIFKNLHGTTMLAKYSLAYTLGTSMFFLTGALFSAITPWTMRKLSAGKEGAVEGISRLAFRGVAGGVLLVVALAPEAIKILAPDGYSEALTAVLPISLSILPSFLSAFATLGLVHSEKNWVSSLSSLLSLAVNIAANLLLIPRLSYFGAGLSLLLSNCALLTVNLLYTKKLYTVKIIDMSDAMRTFLFTLLLGVLFVLLYPYAAVKILLLSVPLVMILHALFSLREFIVE